MVRGLTTVRILYGREERRCVCGELRAMNFKNEEREVHVKKRDVYYTRYQLLLVHAPAGIYWLY